MKGPPASGYNLATMSMTVRVNGEPREVDADPAMPLLWVLRDHFGMTGTKFGCGIGRFQIGNVKRPRRSRHSQRMGGPTKAAALDDFHEHLHALQSIQATSPSFDLFEISIQPLERRLTRCTMRWIRHHYQEDIP